MLPPILLFTIFNIAGVVIADTYNLRLITTIPFAIACLIIHLVFIFRKSSARIVTAALLFLSLGMILTSLFALRLESSLIHRCAKQSLHVTVEGILINDPSIWNDTSSFDMRIRKLTIDSRHITIGEGFTGKNWTINEPLRVRVRSCKAKLHMGEYIRASGFLELPSSDGDFNYRRYLYHRGIMAILSGSGKDIERIDSDGFNLTSFAGSIRHSIKERYIRGLPEDEAALLCGIALGDASLINEELQESFRATGLTHILAASGINIALIIGALWPLLRILRFRAIAQFATLVSFTALYTVVSGLSPSITRAFLMAAIGLSAWFFGRERNNMTSLSAAALILLIADPFIIYDVGFQLSFAATLALIIFMPLLEQSMVEVPKPLRSGLSVTIAAQLGVFPIIIYYFGQASVISLIANLTAAPLSGPALILGMAVLPVETIVAPLGELVYLILRVILGLIIAETKLLANFPGAYVYLGSVSLFKAIICYIVIAFLGLYLYKIKLKIRFSHVLMLLIAISAVSIWWQLGKSMAPSQLEVTFFDVGQGDSAIIITPDNTKILIDGGPDPTLVKRKLEQRGIKMIDAVMISHEDSDHIGGIEKVIENFKIGSFLYPAGVESSKAFLELRAIANRKGINCITVDDGDVLRLGKNLEIDTLHAGKDAGAGGIENDNDNDESAVVMVKYGKFKTLFTGDAGKEIEEGLVNENEDLDADVLKVGHHGSASSSTQDFLREVSPGISVISVGKGNSYGHPSRSTINRLSSIGSKILRTDRNGDVTISSDGDSFRVYTEKHQ